MSRVSRIAIRQMAIGWLAGAFLLIGIADASAEANAGQQAAQTQEQVLQTQQAQQGTMNATRSVQEANRQASEAEQRANQQAMQDAQQAPNAHGPVPGRGYGRADKPRFSPRPGSFSGPVRVTISDPNTPQAEIFYTVDGSEPTIASTPYTGPVLVTSSMTVRAIARSPIYSASRVANGKYVIH